MAVEKVDHLPYDNNGLNMYHLSYDPNLGQVWMVENVVEVSPRQSGCSCKGILKSCRQTLDEMITYYGQYK